MTYLYLFSLVNTVHAAILLGHQIPSSSIKSNGQCYTFLVLLPPVPCCFRAYKMTVAGTM